MNLPQVYTCSPFWTLLLPPSPESKVWKLMFAVVGLDQWNKKLLKREVWELTVENAATLLECSRILKKKGGGSLYSKTMSWALRTSHNDYLLILYYTNKFLIFSLRYLKFTCFLSLTLALHFLRFRQRVIMFCPELHFQLFIASFRIYRNFTMSNERHSP